MKNVQGRCVLILGMSAVAVLLTGCRGMAALDALVPVRELTYNRVEKNTAVVVKGDITPVFDKTLELSGYEETRYRENNEEFEALEDAYKLTLKAVNCQVGKQVKKGEVLVSFSSAELDREINERKEERRLKELELEHIEKLAELDKASDYSGQLAAARQNIKVCDLYIQDINSKYDEINIVCEKDGVVRYINPELAMGRVVTGTDLIIVSQDDGYYKAAIEDTVSFDTTRTYIAGNGAVGYELKVMDNAIVDNDEEAEIDKSGEPASEAGDNASEEMTGDGENADMRIVCFEPIDAEGKILENSIRLTTELNTVKNVCYVDKESIISTDNGDYVYVVNEDEKRRAVRVKTGDVVGDYCIILSGLYGGEIVVLQ